VGERVGGLPMVRDVVGRGFESERVVKEELVRAEEDGTRAFLDGSRGKVRTDRLT